MRENAPSATANLVAKNLLLVAATPPYDRFVPTEAAHLTGLLVEEFSRGGSAFVRRSTRRWFQSLSRTLERFTIPGLALHQALRKRYIERAVRESLAEGFNQVVIVGGGLDSLALRLCAEFPEVNFIELDHPATQRVKQSVTVRKRLVSSNLRLLPVDFTKQVLAEALHSCVDYRAGERTVFISEGVLMYLDACEVDEIFKCVQNQPCVSNRFIFTFMERDAEGRAGFRRSTWIARLWLSVKGEPFRWGLKPEEALSFLRARGFVLKDMATARYFKDMYLREHDLQDAALAEGEHVCVCESLARRRGPDSRESLSTRIEPGFFIL
jgi:methyltransferase (TIGR00027 family)